MKVALRRGAKFELRGSFIYMSPLYDHGVSEEIAYRAVFDVARQLGFTSDDGDETYMINCYLDALENEGKDIWKRLPKE